MTAAARRPARHEPELAVELHRLQAVPLHLDLAVLDQVDVARAEVDGSPTRRDGRPRLREAAELAGERPAGRPPGGHLVPFGDLVVDVEHDVREGVDERPDGLARLVATGDRLHAWVVHDVVRGEDLVDHGQVAAVDAVEVGAADEGLVLLGAHGLSSFADQSGRPNRSSSSGERRRRRGCRRRGSIRRTIAGRRRAGTA